MILKRRFEKLGLIFDDKFYKRCNKFIKLLQEWGKVHNLTGSLQIAQIEDNIVDSLYPLIFLNNFENFVDIGTGAGYPGVLISIARPDIKAVFIEPKTKRVSFLNFVKNTLELGNVQIINSRVEDIIPATYDLITSRAVTNTSLLLNITQHIRNENTEYLFYKGSMCNDEIKISNLDKYEIIRQGEYRNYLYIKRQGLVDDI
ncbi:rRNA small subunit 7-methylguanosine (m7G) methyltransferase GidB [hydrothermal vent metagenome]|uniref:rRNA small subunit 7-methylguanosine (M7G) methyltransferase GidB n=1 Tax=hydrothermal vent metagenome TaxID=652676 RepID=A0A3B1E4D5_9ZZZZ